MLLVACGRGAEQGGGSESIQASDSVRLTRVDAVPITDPATGAKPPCPATGNWAECSVFERLDRAGLAPRRDTAAAVEPPLTAKGHLLRIGSSELELYLYADGPSRERDELKLEKGRYADAATPLSMRPLPTLIRSANLIAILHSRNEHQRERVSDALTAGPPQPSRP